MLEIMPAKQKRLWLAQKNEPSFEDKQSAVDDITEWASRMGKDDSALDNALKPENSTNDIFESSGSSGANVSANLPPVRNFHKETTADPAVGDSDDDDDDEEEEEEDEETQRERRARRQKRYGYSISESGTNLMWTQR